MSTAINKDSDKWDINITSGRGNFDVDLKELWRYRDLMMMFVKKDIITVYKQTVLGPAWFVLQPLFTTMVFVVLFGQIAQLSSDGIPKFAFYLISITLWSYFSDTLNITAKTFTDNSSIFGKVYFPRLIMPLSKIVSGLAKFFIQFAMFIAVWLYYVLIEKTIVPNWYILLTPFILLVIVTLALACGILITSMTTKYRDLSFLVVFAIQLLMYGTPVAYSMSDPRVQNYQSVLWFNPLTSLFEAFKYGFFGKGIFNLGWIIYSTVFTLLLLIVGVVIFNKVEKKFIDTV